MPDYDVTIVGAGLGGLAAGAVLAGKGFKVLICENTGRVGGCCSSVDHRGYRFDIGPSIVEFRWVWDTLFEKIGRRTSDYIRFIEVDPSYGFVTADGGRFSYPADPAETREVIARLSREDAHGWDRFSRIGEEISDIFFGNTMFRPLMTVFDLARFGLANPRMARYMRYVMVNFETVLKDFFSSDAVRASMGMHAYYLGLPPAICPGYAAFLCYTDHQGVYYPEGGMASIPEGMATAFEEEGGRISFDSRVTRILVDNNRARGVELEDGSVITSRAVVSDINARVCYLDLVGRENIPGWAAKAIESYDFSFANPNIMVGIDGDPGLEAHHTVCYSTLEDMNRAWFEDYRRGRIPERGFMLISWPTNEDPSLAPEGHHCLNLVTIAPYELEGGRDWDRVREEYVEMCLDLIERNFGLDLKSRLTFARVNTPKDFERMLLQPRGAIYGLQFDNMSSMIFRPRIRSRAVRGLYLAGSSTHLGGGTPTATASGVLAGDIIAADMDRHL